MKKLFNISTLFLAFGLVSAGSSVAHAKSNEESADSVKKSVVILSDDEVEVVDAKTGNKKKITFNLPGNDGGIITVEKGSNLSNGGRHEDDDDSTSKRNGRPIFGLTFSRIDLGLTKPHHEGDFRMSGDNEIFKYRPGKTVNFGFDVFQAGYRFNENFRLFASAGFDWTYIRLRKSLEFDPEKTPYESAVASGETLTKNRLTSTYLRLPLTFEFRSNDQKTKFAAGPIAGFLLKGTQRFRNEDGDRVKRKGDFGYAPFQYGAFARFGVNDFGIYAKYYFNDMFENSPAGAGLQNLTFGLTLGF